MKHIFRLLACTLFVPLFFSCDSYNENTNIVLVDTLTVSDPMIDPLAGYSSSFKILMVSDSGVFRGKKLGITKSQAMDSTLEKIEQDASTITYNINLSATEYGDIMYTFNKDALSSVEIFVYPKNDSSLVALKTELINFYSKKIGASVSTKKGKTVLLNTQENYGVEWSEEGNRKVKDLRMYVFALSAL
ncbi:hypothetical protein [uncultured Cytophaga sp.]|uniref:hypothetical protein n=1 Tax=uncultured Cytophaga sp. TaxID=160238 RepID=UPI00261FBF65|nr:hypothetical protein [uncultured Cytophaga sp.]